MHVLSSHTHDLVRLTSTGPGNNAAPAFGATGAEPSVVTTIVSCRFCSIAQLTFSHSVVTLQGVDTRTVTVSFVSTICGLPGWPQGANRTVSTAVVHVLAYSASSRSSGDAQQRRSQALIVRVQQLRAHVRALTYR